jgi:hypothetical protein
MSVVRSRRSMIVAKLSRIFAPDAIDIRLLEDRPLGLIRKKSSGGARKIYGLHDERSRPVASII